MGVDVGTGLGDAANVALGDCVASDTGLGSGSSGPSQRHPERAPADNSGATNQAMRLRALNTSWMLGAGPQRATALTEPRKGWVNPWHNRQSPTKASRRSQRTRTPGSKSIWRPPTEMWRP